MTVRELLENNSLIVDASITLLNKDGKNIDQLNIGMDYGVEPPYPTKYTDRYNNRGELVALYDINGGRKAHYIRESINRIDRRDETLWGVILSKIPKKWLELEVWSWHHGIVYTAHHPRDRHVYQDAEGIRIWAKEYADTLKEYAVDVIEEKPSKELDGQISMFEEETNESRI